MNIIRAILLLIFFVTPVKANTIYNLIKIPNLEIYEINTENKLKYLYAVRPFRLGTQKNIVCSNANKKDLEEKYLIKSNMLDFNEIEKTILPTKASFLKKKLGLVSNNQEISINDWIIQADKDIILKLDIEGDEYASLIDISEENLKKIRILVIEFHDLRNLRNDIFLNLFDKVINKLNNYFYVCHLHINNISKIKKIGDYLVPDMIEMTFIRKNRVKNFSSKFSILPHKLDSKTVNSVKEKFLDKSWYK